MTNVHFIGIGGSGLSAIARLLLESGYTVTGSDQAMSSFAADLQTAGAVIHIGHDPALIQGADWVIRSSAIPEDNPEVQAAKAAGIPVFKRADFLGQLMSNKLGIAIAGTHGKTTTTAMLAWTLTQLEQDPSFIVGGVLNNLGVNARAGKGKSFVIEADEYDRMFLGLKPRIEIITNVEHDHPDLYPTMMDMLGAFEAFVDLLPASGTLIGCAENAGASIMLNRARRSGHKTIAYSIKGEITINTPLWILGRSVKPNQRGGFDFEAITNVQQPGLKTVKASLQVPGEHNVCNALAVLAVIGMLDLPLEKATKALEDFTGTGRRFEVRGQVSNITVIDDYAHHPTEIRATLAAARARYPEARIWAVWQPHTYSRTKALFEEFTRSFKDADEVIITEVYAAREAKQKFSSEEVALATKHASVHFISELSEVSNYLLENLHSGDILLVLSAGDADRVSADVLAGLQKR